MTESKGAVGIRVAVPVLGTVTGIRTLKDIVAGVPTRLPTDKPAVVTRDPTSPIRTAAARPVKAAPANPVKTEPAKPVKIEPVKPVKPISKKPAPAVDDEAKAAKLIQLAENYIRAGLKPMAIKKLKEAVTKYPKTKSAEKAEDRIMELEG